MESEVEVIAGDFNALTLADYDEEKLDEVMRYQGLCHSSKKVGC